MSYRERCKCASYSPNACLYGQTSEDVSGSCSAGTGTSTSSTSEEESNSSGVASVAYFSLTSGFFDTMENKLDTLVDKQTQHSNSNTEVHSDGSAEYRSDQSENDNSIAPIGVDAKLKKLTTDESVDTKYGSPLRKSAIPRLIGYKHLSLSENLIGNHNQNENCGDGHHIKTVEENLENNAKPTSSGIYNYFEYDSQHTTCTCTSAEVPKTQDSPAGVDQKITSIKIKHIKMYCFQFFVMALLAIELYGTKQNLLDLEDQQQILIENNNFMFKLMFGLEQRLQQQHGKNADKATMDEKSIYIPNLKSINDTVNDGDVSTLTESQNQTAKMMLFWKQFAEIGCNGNGNVFDDFCTAISTLFDSKCEGGLQPRFNLYAWIVDLFTWPYAKVQSVFKIEKPSQDESNTVDTIKIEGFTA